MNLEIKAVTKLDMSFIPDATSGVWSVSSFEVKPNELSQQLSMIKTGRGVPSGKYKRLMRSGVTVMSNTPDEINDFLPFTNRAMGNILISGFGLGCVVKVLLDKREVEHITVLESSIDVIMLTVPHFKNIRSDKLTVIHADVFEYKPKKGDYYDFVWHDIWDDICADNLIGMQKLHRKFGRFAAHQESWMRDACIRLSKKSW